MFIYWLIKQQLWSRFYNWIKAKENWIFFIAPFAPLIGFGLILAMFGIFAYHGVIFLFRAPMKMFRWMKLKKQEYKFEKGIPLEF